MKRIIDLMVSSTLLLLLSPVFLIVSVCIRLRMGAPILFRQQRPGLNDVPFYVYKFRTMNNQYGPNHKLLSDDQRLTSLGKHLRKLSVDELPQLINVIKGEMSLVGPRPLLMEYLALYTEEQKTRHQVRPGITGWAQVNGRNALTWEDKFKLDIWYVQNQTIWLDVKITVMTIMKVIKKDGITQQGHSTVEKYQGSDHGSSCVKHVTNKSIR